MLETGTQSQSALLQCTHPRPAAPLSGPCLPPCTLRAALLRVFMHAMEVIFVAVFLLFDAAELFGEGSASGAATGVPGERSLLFGSLLSLLILTGQVLHVRPAAQCLLKSMSHMCRMLRRCCELTTCTETDEQACTWLCQY